jgi:excisionase family DNA binding protein
VSYSPPDEPVTPDLLTLHEAARELRLAPDTVRRWTKCGRLPASRLPGPNGKILIHRDDLAALLAGVRDGA